MEEITTTAVEATEAIATNSTKITGKDLAAVGLGALIFMAIGAAGSYFGAKGIRWIKSKTKKNNKSVEQDEADEDQ